MHFRSVVLVSEALESREGTTECIMFLKKFYSVFTACYLLVWPPRLRGWTETGSKLDFYCNSVCNFAKLALMVELFPRVVKQQEAYYNSCSQGSLAIAN